MDKSRILVVEDESIIAFELSDRLKRSGYDVAAIASTGEEAIEKALSHLPNLILMDISLGSEMDGIKAAEEIQLKIDVPIVYLTAYSDEKTLERAKRTQPFGYLIKPFNQRELETTIEVALYKQKIETMLKESERWLEATLKSIGDAIIATDNLGIIKFFNRIAEEITLHKQIAVIGLHISKVFTVIDYRTKLLLEDPVSRILREGHSLNRPNEMILVNDKGNFITIEETTTLIADEKGAVTGVVLVFRDITNKKAALETLTYRLELEKFIFSTANNFINIHFEKIDDEILKVLASIGAITKSEYCFVYQINNNGVATKLYKWSAERAPDVSIAFESFLLSTYHWIFEKLSKNESIRNDDTISFPDWAQDEKEFFLREKIDSFVIVPLMKDKSLEGLVAACSSKKDKSWRDEDDFILRTAGQIILNALERKRTEEVLRKSEERFRAIVEQVTDGIVLYDLSSKKVIACNPAYQKLVGYTEEEILQLTYYDLVAHEKSNINNHIEKTIRRKRHYIGARKHKHKSGIQINVEVRADLITYSGKEVLCVTVRDLTEWVKAKTELKESEQRYRRLFESMAQGIIYQNADGQVTLANPAACEILGLTIDQLLGITPKDSSWKAIREDGTDFPKDEYPGIIALKTSRPVNNVIMGIFHPREERYKWLVIDAIPEFRNGEEKPFRVFSTFTDITEQKIAEEAIKRSEEELKQLNATKDKFFSIVAHDLKSPFLGLLGFANALVENFEELEKEQIKRFIGNINKSTKNLYTLIQHLLEWSRIQTGRIEVNIEKIELYSSVDYAMNLVLANAANKGITVLNEVTKNEFVYADERMLNSIIENLISNGIKFTFRGGEVIVSSQTKENFVEVCVKDSGVGIDEDIQKKIFRLDVTYTSRGTAGEEGTGLGLVLCQEMIERMRGKIWVESEAGKGTAFYFTIPSAK